MVAAAFAGLAILVLGARGARGADGAGPGARPPLDGSLVEREVAGGLEALHAPAHAVELGSKIARRVFEATVEVPRATIELDVSAVRLGRRDARAGAPEG